MQITLPGFLGLLLLTLVLAFSWYVVADLRRGVLRWIRDLQREIGGNSMLSILEDKRPIRAIVYEDGSEFSVGSSGICRIEAYGEPGNHCEIPWLAVISSNDIIARVPANRVTILYESAEHKGAANG